MDEVITPSGPSTYTSSSSGQNMSYMIKIGVVIIILAIFGFNVFTNLGYITDEFAFIIEPIVALFAKITGKTSKTAVKTATAGTREVTELVDETADAIDDTITKVADKNVNVKNLSNNVGQDYEKQTIDTLPKPDDSNSQVQQGTTGKKGFCYVGNWNGFRSCVKVNESTKCLSGTIYDSEQMCRNPELRN
jgi:hypothetical protein